MPGAGLLCSLTPARADGRDVWVAECCGGEGVAEAHEDDEWDQEGIRLRPLRHKDAEADETPSGGGDGADAPREGAGGTASAADGLSSPQQDV